MSDTPRTDAVIARDTGDSGLIAELAREARSMERELQSSARKLFDTVGDRNRIGVQLDLLRDELMRIRARIGETGLLGDHPELTSIAGYCERAQVDIAVLYTPIQERDRLDRELTTQKLECEALKARVKELEDWMNGLDEIQKNTSMRRQWMGSEVGWIPRGQAVYMGPEKPPTTCSRCSAVNAGIHTCQKESKP